MIQALPIIEEPTRVSRPRHRLERRTLPVPRVVKFPYTRNQEDETDESIPFKDWKMPEQEVGYIKAPRYDFF